MGWECAGLRWPGDRPELVWRQGERQRVSVLGYGSVLGFRAMGERHCSGARGNACPVTAVVPGRSTGGRCAECARLDRAHSVAADTIADDPRTYRVYLAWFGPGMVKVGITAEERGAARLREQGAVVFSWLGRGPLMAARRTEEVLRAALGVPDRIPYARKRVARGVLPGGEERGTEIAELYGRAAALEGRGWPESLERLPFAPVDHVAIFGIGDAVGRVDIGAGGASGAGIDRPERPDRPERLERPVVAVRELAGGGVVAGRLVAAAGPDLHLRAPDGGTAVLDTRLLTGWRLDRIDGAAGAAVTVPVEAVGGGNVQGGLF
ncbi:DUF2797 domain-containing protein [uncultured Streptomyces sp.]|uniref:DUF2797 domain-containing protein n=1 Tax=uncultured Streptomyces sp. TaxID=174707 RepID=UPI0026159B1A|nr:DUF2797 domain-containing protein [uncultured Streptomyces sp.]